MSLARQIEGECDLRYLVPMNKLIAPSPEGKSILSIPNLSEPGRRATVLLPLRLARTFAALAKECREKTPHLAICLGSSLSIPVALFCRFKGVPCVFIETITRPAGISKTGRVLALFRLPTRIFVQWPELENEAKGLFYRGTVL